MQTASLAMREVLGEESARKSKRRNTTKSWKAEQRCNPNSPSSRAMGASAHMRMREREREATQYRIREPEGANTALRPQACVAIAKNTDLG